MTRIPACLFLILALTACGTKQTAAPDPGTAVPYQTGTPAATSTVLPGLTEIVLPTPTIFTYTVVQGDTLSRIAQHYGVTLEALLTANPGVQPTSLSVGTKLIIPTGRAVPGEPTPTPAPLPILQAHCWPESTGGLWCFALLENPYPERLENLSAQFTLLDATGQPVVSQIAFALLDILPPGESLPIAAHFPAPVPVESTPRVQLLTSIRLLPGDTRYLPASVENTLVSLDASGRIASLTGRVVLNGEGTAATLWVLATAYDAAGNVVGVRRWNSPSALTAAAPADFDFQVSSLGPEIARVEFLVEARP